MQRNHLAKSMKIHIMSTILMKTIHYTENTVTISITMGNAWLHGVMWKTIHEAYTRDKPQKIIQTTKKMLKITVWRSLIKWTCWKKWSTLFYGLGSFYFVFDDLRHKLHASPINCMPRDIMFQANCC